MATAPGCIFSQIVACLAILTVFTVSLSACRNDELNLDGERDCPSFRSDKSTLADASTMSASVDSSQQGVTLEIEGPFTESPSTCIGLNATVTLNGIQMGVDSSGGPETDPPDQECEDHCCAQFKACAPVVFALAPVAALDSFSGRMDFIVTDGSGSREIVVDGPCATSSNGASIKANVTRCDFESCDAQAICE